MGHCIWPKLQFDDTERFRSSYNPMLIPPKIAALAAKSHNLSLKLILEISKFVHMFSYQQKEKT